MSGFQLYKKENLCKILIFCMIKIRKNLTLGFPKLRIFLKKKVEVLKAKSRPTSPIAQAKKQLNYNEDSSDDEKTVNNDTITVADELKPIYLKAQKYLKTLENEKNSYNLHNNNKAAYEKLNKYMTEKN
jgi:hypothetical protein